MQYTSKLYSFSIISLSRKQLVASQAQALIQANKQNLQITTWLFFLKKKANLQKKKNAIYFL
jgi:hypothetical protein